MLQMGTGVYGESSMMQEIFISIPKTNWQRSTPTGTRTNSQVLPAPVRRRKWVRKWIIMRLGGGALNAATKGITQPLLELGARLGIHSTAGGLMAGVQQVMKNVTTGHSPMEGVQDAVIAGAAQTGIALGYHGWS